MPGRGCVAEISALGREHEAPAAALIAAAAGLHSQAVRSSYTQHPGLVRNAAVTRTVAHDPTRDFQRFDRGDTISVLVDPLSQAALFSTAR